MLETINILYGGKHYVQVIPVSATIGQVKLLLEKTFEIPLKRMELHYNHLPLSDDLNMNDIYPQVSEFRLYKKIRLWINTSFNERYIAYWWTRTLVDRLKELLHANSGIVMDKKKVDRKIILF